MPDTSEAFPDIGAASPGELELMRREIITQAAGNYDGLSMDTLKRLAAITAALRRKTAGPPKEKKARKPKTVGKSPKATLDDALKGLL